MGTKRPPRNIIQMAGKMIGPWKVLTEAPRPATTRETGAFWLCECVCLRKTREVLSGARLRAGRFNSGCVHCAQPKGPFTGTSAHESYRGMIERCTNPRHSAFKYYGGRGITVCSRWMESGRNFLEDMGPRPPHTSLDRINNDGNYEPSNCRWADARPQARNKKSFKITDEQIAAILRLLEDGARQIDIAEACGVSRGYIGQLKHGKRA